MHFAAPLDCTFAMPLANLVPLLTAATNTLPGPALLAAAHFAPCPVWFVAAVHYFVPLLR